MDQPLTSTDDILRGALRDVLGLADRVAAALDRNSPLFGALPELDSMALATLLTDLEDRFDIVIDDEDVDGEIFETFGALADFVTGKLNARG